MDGANQAGLIKVLQDQRQQQEDASAAARQTTANHDRDLKAAASEIHKV